MRILITATDDRPGTFGKKLTGRLCAAGHDAVHRPLIQFLPCQVSLKLDLTDYDFVVCVSRHAAHYFFCLPALSGTKIPGGLPPFFVPGRTTAAYLKERGIPALFPREGTGSEAILKLKQFKSVCRKGTRALLLCGQGGRPLLQETLERAGVRTDIAVLYKILRQEYDEKNEEEFSLVWVTSGHILRALLKQNYPWLRNATLVIPGPRLEHLAKEKDVKFGKIVMVRDAYDDTFINYVNELTKRKTND